MADTNIGTAIAVLQERGEQQHARTMQSLAEIKTQLVRLNGTSRENGKVIATLMEWRDGADERIRHLNAVSVKASLTGDVISALTGVLAAIVSRFIQ